jgi:glutamate/tyrosine decarboxylase-like PLP-dependent enzyme
MEFVTAPAVPNLEFSVDDMRRMADAVVARSIEHVASLGAQPVLGDVNARAFFLALREPAPEAGCGLEPLLDQLFDDYIPRSFNAPAPGYLAFIPGGGVFPAALADFITNMANRFTGLWRTAPALVQLEANALDWLRDWMGFPETTRGLFTAGGSRATFNALLCARALRAAHEATADYMPAMPHPDDFYDPSHHGPDLSRGFPGLRVWLTVKLYGAAVYRAAIAEKRALALDAHRRLAALPGLVIDTAPELSLFAFHVTWPGASLAEEDAATRRLMDRTTARGRVMLSGAVARGRYLGRVCVLNFRTHAEQIDWLVEDVEAALREISGVGESALSVLG